MNSETLLFMLHTQKPMDLARLQDDLPIEWIEKALRATGHATIRRRRLPAEQVVWLVVALALWRHHSMSEVLDELDLALPSETAPFVCKSAITQARERVGAEPLAWLFRESASAWAAQSAHALAWKGLRVWAVDGTSLRLPDTPEHRACFGSAVFPGGRLSSYPMARAVTLTQIPSHLVLDAEISSYEVNEMMLAKQLVERIPDFSLVVFDRGFMSAEILQGLRMAGKERHFLIPAKSNAKWERVSGDQKDGLVRMKTSAQARKKMPSLPEYWEARMIEDVNAEAKSRFLLTSLTDRRRFKAKDLIARYNERWEIEGSYKEVKQVMLGMNLTLRSRTPDGVRQEIWGAFIAYNLVRQEMARAAQEAGLKPTELSFVRSFHAIQNEMMWAAGMKAQGKMPALLKRLRKRIQETPNQKRPGRKAARVVKSVPVKYAVRRTYAQS